MKRYLLKNKFLTFFYKILSKKNKVKEINDICKDFKSIKNITEIKNARKAHLKDGVALVKFFYWLERNLDKKISEFEASKKLEIFRRENKDFFAQVSQQYQLQDRMLQLFIILLNLIVQF